MLNRFRIGIVMVLTGLAFCRMSAQLNLKVGYMGAATPAPVVNKIIGDFNTRLTGVFAGSRLDDKLQNFNYANGMELGLRYRMGHVGFEVGWSNVSDKSDVLLSKADGSLFQDKWFLSLTEYSLGVENYFGYFGYGASLGYRTARLKTDIPGASKKKRTVTTESAPASKFYLIFQFPGDKVGIAFKPYVQVPLKKYDVSGFDQEINAQIDPSWVAPKPQEEKFLIYGISILLYNGKQ